jgi:hypothetical protein
MEGNEPIDLVIMLRIVDYISSRSASGGAWKTESSQIISIINNLAGEASLGMFLNNETGETFMRDSYVADQAGVMGPESHAESMTLNQTWAQQDPAIDLRALEDELRTLREALRSMASTPEHDIAIAAVANAEIAARSGDGDKALTCLRNAGKWVLEVATNIGTAVASAAITAAIGKLRWVWLLF